VWKGGEKGQFRRARTRGGANMIFKEREGGTGDMRQRKTFQREEYRPVLAGSVVLERGSVSSG